MIASTFAAALSAVLLAHSASAACTREYTAQDGDICDSISAAQNVSTFQFATVNYGTIDAECSNIVPGQTYCLGNDGEDCSTTTVIASGDTCEGIQAKAGINSTILWANNPQINDDCTNIYIGEVLCVAGTVEVPVAPAGATPATSIPATATPAVTTAAPTTQVAVVTPPPAEPTTTAEATTTSEAALTSEARAPEPTTTEVTSEAPTSTEEAAPEPTDGGEGDDDDDLPFCDEL